MKAEIAWLSGPWQPRYKGCEAWLTIGNVSKGIGAGLTSELGLTVLSIEAAGKLSSPTVL